MTLQEQLALWNDDTLANAEIDIIIDQLNDGVINPEVGPTVKTPALQLVVKIEDDRAAYIADRIARIEEAILEEERMAEEEAGLEV